MSEREGRVDFDGKDDRSHFGDGKFEISGRCSNGCPAERPSYSEWVF